MICYLRGSQDEDHDVKQIILFNLLKDGIEWESEKIEYTFENFLDLHQAYTLLDETFVYMRTVPKSKEIRVALLDLVGGGSREIQLQVPLEVGDKTFYFEMESAIRGGACWHFKEDALAVVCSGLTRRGMASVADTEEELPSFLKEGFSFHLNIKRGEVIGAKNEGIFLKNEFNAF